ncbi:MAG TPA: hypothetical protein VHW01_06420 [Polyangiaceae bacterium]|jgi:hypothetical protein|nr:hypothetical protein [Polyangiaceae bacterium]
MNATSSNSGTEALAEHPLFPGSRRNSVRALKPATRAARQK